MILTMSCLTASAQSKPVDKDQLIHELQVEVQKLESQIASGNTAYDLDATPGSNASWWQTFWGAFGAISTAVGAIAMCSALALIFWAKRQLRFDAWVHAQDLFNPKHEKDEFITARKIMFRRYHNKETEWSGEEREQAMLVCRQMDQLVQLAPFLTEKKILNTWYDNIGKCWHVVEGIVKEEQEKWPQKWKAFERLGRKAYSMVQKDSK